ncbi:MAG TPA: cupin domain-containing protein [Euryarchaeota archaeon]|nr:cupin domain-containing protein [Euryarchaeota archaeon]
MIRSKLIRKGEAIKQMEFEGKTLRLEAKSEKMESIFIRMEEGTEFGRMFSHEGEEIHIVLRGTVEYMVGGQIYHLEVGDTLWHDSSLPHTARNAGKGVSKSLTISTGPTFM